MSKRIVKVDFCSTIFNFTKFQGHQLKFEVLGETLGDVIDQIKNIVPFSLIPFKDSEKYWVLDSIEEELNGITIDVHYVIPCGIIFRHVCPGHDLRSVIPEDAVVSIGGLAC